MDNYADDLSELIETLDLVVSAGVLWNTVYLERAVQVLRNSGIEVDDRERVIGHPSWHSREGPGHKDLP